MKIAAPQNQIPNQAVFNAGLKSIAAERGIVVASSALKQAANEFVTLDEDMRDMLNTAQQLAEYQHPVLILGETGTGKELIARVLHGNRNTIEAMRNRGIRRDCFYPINCSGIPNELFESLLFGHKKGSFSGAFSDELGILRAAANGTAFLDEVGDLPLAQQTKLLRVIQTSRVRPVGDTNEYTINCRFVFATNKEPRELVRAKAFRADLYYRISTFVLRTKPLRERECDIEAIVKRICARERVDIPAGPIPPAAYADGNVRSLTNWILRRELVGMTDEQALVDL